MSENNEDHLLDPPVQHKSDSQTGEGTKRSSEAFGDAGPTVDPISEWVQLLKSRGELLALLSYRPRNQAEAAEVKRRAWDLFCDAFGPANKLDDI